MRSKILALLAGLMVVGVTGSACAQEPTQVIGESRPRLFAWLLPSDTGHYVGYHVGGGAGHPRKAEPRRDDEGTWGWDYQGLLPRRVILGWWHGRRTQGGIGAYRTDGAKVHPDR